MTDSQTPTRSNFKMLLGISLVCFLGIGAVIVLLVSRQGQAAAGPSVVYILDSSARMQLPAEGASGETRLEVARAVLAELVRPADPSLVSSLRVFGSGAQSEPCRDTDLAVPFSAANQTSIIAGLEALAPGQTTDAALTTAMVAAIRDLSTRPGPHWLIVVTGGADTCNPDGARLVADELERTGIELDSFVIGFQMTAAEQAAVESMMSELPGGQFVTAGNSDELQSAVNVLGDRISAPSDLLTRLAPGVTSTLLPSSTPTTGPALTSTPATTAIQAGDGVLIPGTGCPEAQVFDPATNQCRPVETQVAETAAAEPTETPETRPTRPPLPTPIDRFTPTPPPGKFTPTPPTRFTPPSRFTPTPPEKVTATPTPGRPLPTVRVPTNTPPPRSTRPPQPATVMPPKDSDGDGLPDADDACPGEPGPAENRGCPVRDSDGDGVPDDRDACPGEPGPADNRGCPIPPPRGDSDGDGVPDGFDRCPGQPGPAENHGCPLTLPTDPPEPTKPPPPPPPTDPPPPPPTEPPPPPKATDPPPPPPPGRGDTDGDGVPDAFDSCPGEPGPADNGGCPHLRP